jgi:hypothetical protein
MTRVHHLRRAGWVRGVAGVVVGVLALAVVVVPASRASAATDVVTNCSGSVSVSGSLPFEVANSGSGDTITFALSPACASIPLGATLDIAHSLTITGPGADSLAVNGTGSSSVFTVDSGTVTISGLSIENGGSGPGGGIENDGSLTVLDSTVSGNSAEVGGGIFNGSDGTLTMSDSTVSDNNASNVGGGIENQGTAVVQDSTISGNTASYGGGGIDSEFATLTVSNSTVAGNSAGQEGGGIYIFDSYDPSQPIAATITNSTLSDNGAAFGGGISDDQGPLALGATLVANNASGNDCFLELAPLTDDGYNLDDDGTCQLTDASDLPSTDAGLDPAGLQDNGGPTATIALTATSPAVDHVSDAALCPATDQRGMARTAPCDIGSYDTDVAVVAACTPGTTTCSTTIVAPSQSLDVVGSKLVSTTASITVSVATDVLSCPNFSYAAPVATLIDTGLKDGTTVSIVDIVKGLPNKKGVVICYQPGGSSTALFLKKCHGKKPVACYNSVTASGGNATVTLQVPAGDPRFHVGAEAPAVSSFKPAAAAPGKKLTIKGSNLSEVTGVTIGNVAAHIIKTAPTKVTVTVPPGARSGLVHVTSLAGASSTLTVFDVI